MKKSTPIPILSILLLGLPSPVLSQELNERLEVEGAYEFDRLPAPRLDRLPQFERFQAGDSRLPYSLGGVAASFSPSAPDAPASVWGGSRPGFNPRGYLDMSLGSFLNSSLSAGYAFIRRSNEHLGVRLHHNSTSLWRPYGADSPERFSYQDCLGVDYSRTFKGKGTLDVSGQYHIGYFNYFGGDPVVRVPDPLRPPGGDDTSHPAGCAPTQTLNDASARIEWRSFRSAGPGNVWDAHAGARYFGYRTATRELDVALGGNFLHSWNSISSLGINAEGNILTYFSAPGMPHPPTYGGVSLTPFYRWRKNAMTLHAGADLDFTFNASGTDSESRYAIFHAAPDVRFNVAGRNVGFYVDLTGGTELHTLAATSQIDPYRNPQLISTRPTYTPIDANMGLDIFPFAGFRARINLQYKSTRNVWAGGWYSAMLDYGHAPSMPEMSFPADSNIEYGDGYQRYNLSGFGAGIEMSYVFGGLFRIEAEGAYTYQRDEIGIFNGLDRPRWVIHASARVNPLERLTLCLDYSYRGVRRIFATYIEQDTSGLHPGGAEADPAPKVKVAGMSLPDINSLDFMAEWKFNPRLAVSFEARNLLNRKHLLLPGLPSEGINFSGGIQWLFE